jgi:hypothetical protein
MAAYLTMNAVYNIYRADSGYILQDEKGKTCAHGSLMALLGHLTVLEGLAGDEPQEIKPQEEQ